MMRVPYPTDLSDDDWARVAPLLPAAKTGGRPRDVDLREILNAAVYRERGGCSWRLLPHEFPPWQTVYTYVHAWQQDGTWARIMAALREPVAGQADASSPAKDGTTLLSPMPGGAAGTAPAPEPSSLQGG